MHQNSVFSRPFHVTAIGVLLVFALFGALLAVGQQPHAHAVTPFTSVFSTNAPGDITFVSNTLQTCSTTGANGGTCVSNGQNGTWANNNFTMINVDVDADPTTPNSSSNDLTLGAGASVLFAGLFWVGYANNANVFDGTVKFATPAGGGYSNVNALHIDNLGSRHFGAYADVTALVQAAGNGTYTVADLDLDTGAAHRYGGWTLAVAFEDNAEPWRNLSIFNGYDFVYNANSYNVPLTVSGFNAPPIGPVSAKIGVQTGEGDARYTGPRTQVNGTDISDAMNPANNVQNSSISILGTPANTIANPSYPNQLGFDADIIAANGLIAPNATSANLNFRSTGDVYGINVITTAIDIYVPNLTSNLEKTGTDLNGEVPHPGDVIEYRMTFDNTGEDPATGVTITDIVPAGTTYVPNSLNIIQDSTSTGPMTDAAGDDNAFFDAGSNTATFYVGNGATPTSGGTVVPLTQGGQEHEVAFQVMVDDTSAFLTVSNTASVDYVADFINEAYTATTNPVEHEIVPLVDLSITKTDAVDPVNAGDNIVYTITVDNAGPSTADNVVITDTLPAGVTFVSGAGCTAAGLTLTCNAGNIASGGSASVVVTVAVDPGLTGSSLTNIASVTSDTHEHDTTNNATKETTALGREADLSIEKSAPATIAAGTNLTYDIEVSNLGSSDALNVTMTDPLPAGVTYVSAAADLGGSCTAAVVCTWPSLVVGATSVVTIVVDVPASTADGTLIVNKASVKGSDPDPDSSNNADAVTTEVKQLADLVMTKSAPAAAVAGDQVTYTLDIENLGPSDAVNAMVTDPVPSAGFTFNTLASSSGCSLAAGTITCNAGTLAAGATGSFTVVFDLSSAMVDGTVITNIASASSDTDDPVPGNNDDTVDTTIVREADLSIRKDDNTALAIAGSTITYSLEYDNSGDSDATGVVITDTLPAGTTFNAGLSDGICSAVGSIVTCNVGAVANGASGTVTIVVDTDPSIVDGAALHNEATIDGNEDDPALTNNSTFVDTPTERSAELEMTKVDNVDPVLAGEDVTYTITVKNIGPSVDDNIVMTDTLPSGVTFVSSTPGCTHAAGVVTCPVGSLIPGASSSFDITVTTDASLADGTALVNNASADGDASPVMTVSEVTTVETEADLSVMKVGPATVVAGTSITYTVVVANAGPSDAQNVQLTDALPTGASYSSHTVTSGTGTCTATASNVSCSQSTLAPGATFVVEIVVDLNETLPDGGLATNTALVSTDTKDPNLSNNNDEADTDIEREADLEIAKTTITPSVIAGEKATFQVTVTNNGPSQATGVVVTDTLPAGFTFDLAGSSSGCVAGISCTVPTPLLTGESYTFTIVADVVATTAEGTYTNDASVSGTEPDPVASNDDASSTIDVIAQANLSTLKSSTATTFIPGTTHSYEVMVTNAGPSTAQNVVVTDTLPTGLTLNPTGTSPACVAGVSCTAASLAPGASITFTIVVDVDSSLTGSVVNDASVASDTDDPDPSNNTDSDTTPLVPVADLSIMKSAAPTVMAGNNLVYTIDVANAGPSDAGNVVVTDALPTGATFVSAPGCTEAGGVVTCTAAAIPAGGATSYTITVAIPASAAATTILTNDAGVDSDASDPDPSNDGDSVDTEILRETDLTISKAVAPAIAVAGTTLTYTIVVENAGPSNAAAVSVTDTMPTGITATSVSTDIGFCSSTGAAISCFHPDLPPGTPMTITVNGTIDAAVADGLVLTNSASTSTTSDETDTTNNDASADVTIETSADLAVTKVSGVSEVIAGETISYTIEVTNSGPSDAQNVVLTDTVPADLTIDAVAPAFCSFVGGTVTCSAGTIADGDTVTITIDATVSEDAADGSTLSNTATATSDTDDPDPSNDSGTNETDVAKSADLSIAKSAAVGTISAGETLLYNLTVANAGSSSATNIVVTDTLPAGVTFNPGLSDTNCTAAGSTVTCTFASLAAAADFTFVIAVDLPSSLADGTELTNTASVDADEDDPNAANDTDDDKITIDNQADLSIVKDANGTVVAGESITWDLNVANAGPADAVNVVVTDNLPAGTSFNAAGSDPRCSAAGSVVSCVLSVLASGTTDTFVIEVDVASSVADLATLTNTAGIASDTDDPDPTDNSSSDDVPVTRESDISIVKADLTDPVIAGGQAQWSITVDNAGSSDAANVSIVDALPAGFTFVSVDDTTHCSATGNTVNCLFPVVVAGDSVSILITADVDSSLADGVTHQNTATADSDSSDPVSDTEDTTVNRESDLGITKTSDGAAIAGTNQTYTIEVTNDGSSDADNVVVTDALPAGISFVSDSLGACSAVGAVVTCTLGTIVDQGSVSFDIVVAVSDAAANPTVNQVDVDSDSTDPDPANDDASDSVDITYEADLTITKTASPDPATPGEDITWTIVVTNDGPSIANNVVTTDALPLGVSFVSATAGCVEAGGTVTCTTAALTSGAQAGYTIVGNLASSMLGSVANTASTTSDTPDPDPSDNSATSTTDLEPSADLAFTKTSSPDPVVAGELITYTLTTVNNGPSDALNVVVTDILPANLTAVATTPPGDCTVSGQTVTCSTAVLVDNGIYAVTIEALVDEAAADGSQLSNTAGVASDTPDPDPSDNTATETTDVEKEADLSVAKSTAVTEVSGGERLIYAIEVTNDGPSSATNVVVTDILPTGVVFDPALSDSACAEAAGVVTCTYPVVTAGTSFTFNIVVDVPTSMPNNSTLTNNVGIGADENDPDPSNNNDTHDVEVVNNADLSIVKDANGFAVAGESVAWDLNIANAGDADADNVVITDTLPAGTTFDAVNSDPRCSAAGSTITCNLGIVGASTTDTLTITVDVASSVAAAGVLTNTASIASDTNDPDPGNNSSSDDVPVERDSELSIVKYDIVDPVVAGGTIQWVVMVSNSGPSDAANVTITDSLPSGLTLVSVDDTTNCSTASNTVSCSFPTVANGASVAILVTAEVDSSLAHNEPIFNVATAASDSSDPVSDTEESTATRESDLAITKTSDTEVVAGTNQDYVIEVTNSGLSDADNVLVTDVLPAGLSFVSDSLGACTPLGATGSSVECALGTIAAGDTVSFTFTVYVDDAAGAQATNNVVVDSDSADPDPDNNIDTDVTDVSFDAELRLEKTAAPDPATPGEDVTWTLTVTNDGPSIAVNTVVTDPLPSGASFVSASAGCSYDAAAGPAGVVSCSEGSLASGASITYDIVATVDESFTGPMVNTASVTSDTPDSDPTNNETTSSTPTSPVADLSLEKALLTDPVIAGSTADFALTVSNAGSSTATNIVVTDVLPAGTTYVSGGADCVLLGPPAADGSVSCTVTSLAADANVVFPITVLVDSAVADGDTLVNTASVVSTTDDPDPVGNESSVDVPVTRDSELTLSKVSLTEDVVAGQPIEYEITVANLGASDADNVVVIDELAAGLTLDTLLSTDCSEATGVITCNAAVLAAGSSVTFGFIAQVDEAFGAGVTVRNAATATSESSEPVEGIDEVAASATSTIDVTKTVVTSEPLVVGQPVTWEITATNNGPSTAINPVIADEVSDAFTDVEVDSADCSVVDNVVSCAKDALVVGETWTLQVTATPTNDAAGAQQNTVDVDSDTSESVTETVDFVIETPAVDLEIGKKAENEVTDVGDYVKWTIEVENKGEPTTEPIMVDDRITANQELFSVSSDDATCTTTGDNIDCVIDPGFEGIATISVVTQVTNTDAKIENTATLQMADGPQIVTNGATGTAPRNLIEKVAIAFTGAETLPLVATALMFMVIGALLVGASRRRHSKRLVR